MWSQKSRFSQSLSIFAPRCPDWGGAEKAGAKSGEAWEDEVGRGKSDVSLGMWDLPVPGSDSEGMRRVLPSLFLFQVFPMRY